MTALEIVTAASAVVTSSTLGLAARETVRLALARSPIACALETAFGATADQDLPPELEQLVAKLSTESPRHAAD